MGLSVLAAEDEEAMGGGGGGGTNLCWPWKVRGREG